MTAYGRSRTLRALAYTVVWPKVLGLRPLRIVVVRDPAGKLDDAYLFTTDLGASLAWVIETFARRWSVEVLFRASKQVLDIEAPQHWCRRQYREASALGLAHAKCGNGLVSQRRSRFAGGRGGAGRDGALGQ